MATDEAVRHHQDVLQRLGPTKVRECLDLGRWHEPDGWKTMQAEAYLEQVGARGGEAGRDGEAEGSAKDAARWKGLIAGLVLLIALAALFRVL